MNKKAEALHILNELYKDITSCSRELLLILRKCQHVCEILGLSNEKLWFYKEINGYAKGTSPNYRYISGVYTWVLEGDFLDEFSYEFKINQQIQELKSINEIGKLEVSSGINWIISCSNTGFTQKTFEEKNLLNNNKNYRFRKVGYFQNYEFKNLLYYIEQYTFNWISKTYVNLKYSSQIQTLWERYQSIVESALNKINLSNHLSTINNAIIDDNPENWRLAVLGSRNLLHDLAEYLWRDPRPTYSLLKGSGKAGELDVTPEKYVNRLCAYLHQKEITGTQGKFLRGEFDKLGISISNLNSLEGIAHETISRELFETVVLFTYFLIGELTIKTDFKPVINYDTLAIE